MIVYDQNRKAVELKKELGAGGEGRVYQIAHAECAKIYAKPSPFKEAKILTMIAKPPHPLTDPRCRNGRVAWPTRALYKRPGGSFVGYVMPLIEVNRYQESEVVFIEKLRTKTYGQRFTYEQMMIAAYNFAMTVACIHRAGHAVGDLREKNILVDDQGQICLVDCDSFQIIDEANQRFYASQTYTPAYLAPEWIGRDLSHANRRSNDCFALGVWIFQMLMNGMHPYQAKGGKANHAPSLSEKIKKGTYPYAGAWGVQPPPAAPDFNQVPKNLQKLFADCFVKGHRKPEARPEAMDYARVLKREIGRLKTCKANRTHKYSGDRITCPFCREAGKKGGQNVKPPKRPKVQRNNPKMLASALHAAQVKPPAPSLPAMSVQGSGFQQGGHFGHRQNGLARTSGKSMIRMFSAGLLILMFSAGAVGLFMGVAALMQAIDLPPSGWVVEEGEEKGKQNGRESSSIEIISEKAFLEGLNQRKETSDSGHVEVIREETFLKNLAAQ